MNNLFALILAILALASVSLANASLTESDRIMSCHKELSNKGHSRASMDTNNGTCGVIITKQSTNWGMNESG